MTTYFITFANIFEAAAFKEFLYTNYKSLPIHYFNYRACSISAQTPHFISAAILQKALSKKSIVKYKQVRKGITKYILLRSIRD